MAWSTHKDATGRTYYYNSVTKQSSWDKPPELKSAFERALDCSDWTEYATDSGKKYYHNAVTKETTWKIPDEFQEILESMKFEAEMQVAKQQAPMVLNFDTKEEAEDAWIEMLRVVGVEPDWTWEQCVRKASSNPIYRALKTVAERKEAFDTYCRETKAEKHEAKLKKQADDEKNLQKLFSETPEINGFTRFKVAERLFEENPVWTNCLPQNRKNYFFTYVDELKLAQKESNRELRKSNLAKIKNLFGVLSVSAATSWKEFQNLYSTHPLFTNDQEFSKMDVFDILVAFEDHILTLDSQFRQERQLRLKEQRRTERIIRDAYKDLLREAKRDGRLTHKSQWKDFYVTIKDDPRFTAMFGTSGSTPLELYWDVQIKMEDSYRAVRRVISDLLYVC
jgi:pre-mRNA-processing factor 40